MFLAGCITPHLFEFIKFPYLGKHYMDDYVHIIDQHPLQVIIPLMMIGILLAPVLYLFFQVFCDGPDLGLIICLTDNKKISDSLVDLAEIKGNDIVPLFLLYCGNDGFDDFRVPR